MIHGTPLQAKLHWLPIKDRIFFFKFLLLTCKALQSKGPIDLKELFSLHHPSLNLRSVMDPLILNLLKTRLKTFGDKAFSVVAAREWNNLPLSIRSSNSIIHFKSLLKTPLFEVSVEGNICLKSALKYFYMEKVLFQMDYYYYYITSKPTISSFKHSLKTFLFGEAFFSTN